METRIIKAVFGASKSIVAPKRFKNDWGQVLELVGIALPQTFTAHFANSKTGTAKKRVGQNNQVDIPDEFFKSGADIYCWVMVHDTVSDGRTMYTVRIPIEDRGTATDEEPTPVQQDVIEQAIAALNAAVEQTAQDVGSADASAQSASDSADRAETARDTAEGYVVDAQNYAQQAQASANNASASATASAQLASTVQQIKTDVDGMVDEAQSAAGASAQSALESEQSASQASASATSASQSADTASIKASEASASAQTAGAKATEASNSASTASQKASESSQSASAASGYATQAGQAKTAAETAQGLAEQAQTNAESAKDDAESARDEAQQIVSGISGKVEQIDQNTADIASLEADRYKAYVTDTATGAVAPFPDGANDVPMKDVKVQIEPVQDLHGQESPYPAGGGVNQWDEEWEAGVIDAQGAPVGDSNNIRSKNYIPVNPSTTYYGKCTYTIFAYYYDADKNFISGTVNITNNTFTTPQNCYYIKIRTYGYGGTYNHDISINYPSTDHDYHPYSNICPISGWTGVNVSKTGVNVWDEEWETGSISGANGNPITDNTRIRSKNYNSCLPSTQYYCVNPLGALNIAFYDAEKAFISMSGNATNVTFTTPQNCRYFKIRVVANDYTSGIAINYPSSVKTYSKGFNSFYPITFPQEAGTVYGGTLDVTTGELVVDRAMVDLGTLNWEIDGTRFKASVDGMPNKAGRSIKMLCDCYKSLVNGEAYDQNANNVCYGAYSRVYVHDFAYTDASIFKTAVTGHQLVYELTTPITYQLTPTEIRSLLGTNNVWADTGDTTAEYRADTKLYISKKIAEAISALS